MTSYKSTRGPRNR